MMAVEGVDVDGKEYADSWKEHAHILDGVAVTMNCNLGSDLGRDKESMEKLRESLPKLISDLWRQDRQVDIICLQGCPGGERNIGTGCIWLGQTLIMLKDVSGDPWERVGDQSDTGSEFNVILYNAKKYKKSGNQRLPEFKLTSDNIGYNQIINRHVYCCLEVIDTPNSKMGILSYHGPENDTKYGGKKVGHAKEDIAKRFLEQLANHVKNTNIPLLIGGDWNVEINRNLVGSHSDSMGRFMMQDITDRSCVRRVRNKIDYFVAIDHWDTRKRTDNFARLINLSGRVEAIPHKDTVKAKDMDHDPIVLPYRLITLDCDSLGVDPNSSPRFPKSLVSRYLHTGASRLKHDENVIFPSRCLKGITISDIITWGELLEQQKDEVLIRYHYWDETNTYLEGSDMSQLREKSSPCEKSPISLRNVREEIHNLLQDQKQNNINRRIKNTNLTKTNLRNLDRRNEDKDQNKLLRNHVFPNIFGYQGTISTQKEAVDVCHDILCGEDTIVDETWSQEQMNQFIDVKLRERRASISESVSRAFTESSATERIKLLNTLSDLLGKEIIDGQLKAKEITQENLKRLRKPEIVSAFVFAGIGINRETTKAILCDKILELKNDTHQYSTPERNSVLDGHLVFNSVGSTTLSNSTSSSLESSSAPDVQTADSESPESGEEERNKIIFDGLVRVHRAIQETQGKPYLVLNADNVRTLQNHLLKEKYPKGVRNGESERVIKNNLIGMILGDQLWTGSLEYANFKKDFSKSYAATTYIEEYLVKKVTYETTRTLAMNSCNGHDPVRKRLEFEQRT